MKKHWALKKIEKNSSWGKVNTYRGVTFRSKWETYVAKMLYYSDIDYKYEPKRFFLTKTINYLPDFYLERYKAYIEVKGWLNEKDKLRIQLFKAKYPYPLIYLGADELAYVYGKPASYISKMDVSKHVPDAEELKRFHEVLKRGLSK